MKKYVLIGLMALLVNGVTADGNNVPKNYWFFGTGLGNYSISEETKFPGQFSILNTDSDGMTTGVSLKGGYTVQLTNGRYLDFYIFHNSLVNRELDHQYSSSDLGFNNAVHYQQGYAANLGKHVSPKLSVYGMLGLAHVYYDINYSGNADQYSFDVSDKGMTDLGFMYGFGIAYKVSSRLTVDLAYTTNTSAIMASTIDSFPSNFRVESFEATLSGLTLSTSYNF
jgi:opacity protein-like surface antigen